MSCVIVLKNFNGSYFPGDTISGHVVCEFSSTTKFRGIRVKLRGKEHTSWTDTESYYDHSQRKTRYRHVHYSGNNTIVTNNQTLQGEGTLPPGRYEYPFTFTLPRDLPSTFVGSYGNIMYYVKANVDKPYAIDYKDKKIFNIISLIDFNQIGNQLQLNPVNYVDEKNLSCCNTGDLITMNVQLQKEAFILGELSHVRVDISNMTNTSLKSLTLRVEMTVESRAQLPRQIIRNENVIVTSASDTGVGAHGQRTYQFDLEIPRETMLPNFNRSSLFNQWCEIKVIAALPGCRKNMSISAAIKLGHVPLSTRQPIAMISGDFLTSVPNVSGVYPQPPPYSEEDNAGFEIPRTRDGPFPNQSAEKLPVPVHSSSSHHPARHDEYSPSAPSKLDMKTVDKVDEIGENSSKYLLPTYQDAIRQSTSNPSAPPL